MKLKLFFLALLFPLIAHADFVIGQPTKDVYAVPACKDPVSMDKLIALVQSGVGTFPDWFGELNKKGQVCGMTESRVIVLGLHKVVTIQNKTVYVIVYIAEGIDVPLLGLSHIPIKGDKQV